MSAPETTAVIVSWNTADLLEQCLTALEMHAPDTAVVVVDNASNDESVAVARRHPHVRVIENDSNVGFCRATNQGVRASRSPWLLLVNADAFVTHDCVQALLRRGRGDPRAAVVAPRLVYADGRFQRWTAGRAPSLASMGSYLSGADRLSRRLPALEGHYLGYDRAGAFTPDWVSSACMLVRRAALDDIGLLDERMFVYMDDVDLCQRARDAGWRVWYEPAVTAVHVMGQSSLRATGRPSPEALRAFNRYFARRHGVRRTRALRALQAAGFGARALVHAGAYAVRRDPRHRAAVRTHVTHLQVTFEEPEFS